MKVVMEDGSWCLLTDGLHELVEESEGEQRLWQLPEKHLERPGDDVDVLPLAVVQVKLFLWVDSRGQEGKQRETHSF